MNTYIARQPIFDRENNVFAYELLYRNDQKKNEMANVDGKKATYSVISDVLVNFNIEELTNNTFAFINFPYSLLADDTALLLDKGSVVIEILEDVKIDNIILEKIKSYKKLGYKIALDDFIGNDLFDEIMPYIDIIKVDFLLTDIETQNNIAKKYVPLGIKLLAEKVETREEFERAIKQGYSFFQGYFFSKPNIMTNNVSDIYSSSIFELFKELNCDNININNIVKIVERDASLTYKLLKYMNTIDFYRSKEIVNIKTAILQLGFDNFKKWITIILMRDSGKGNNDEVIKTALIRAIFAESFLKYIKLKDVTFINNAYMTCLLSLIDVIVGDTLEKIIDNIAISSEVKDALRGGENVYREILDSVIEYENGKFENVFINTQKHNIDISTINNMYFDALKEADQIIK